MFLAVISKPGAPRIDQAAFLASARQALGARASALFPHASVAFASVPEEAAVAAAPCVSHCVATGVLFEHPDRPGPAEGGLAAVVAGLYRQRGAGFARHFHGHLACAIFDPEASVTTVIRDHVGVEPLYWADLPESVVFASRAMQVAACLPARLRAIDPTALARFLCFNYNPAGDTIWAGIRKFPPGHIAKIANGEVSFKRYWRLDFSSPMAPEPSVIVPQLRELLERSVSRRAACRDTPGVFVSGGFDSSTVLALVARERSDQPFAFSYRCQGPGFDESHYARLMAQSVGARYHETEYTPQDVHLAETLVGEMSEPFCDCGINIATGLLGRSAQGLVGTVLTGDGGDELFGGHPVYEADKVARLTDRIPVALAASLGRLLGRLPDSDKKKTLGVKLKRFGESLSFPRELRTNRWRLYYAPGDLRGLLSPDVWHDVVEPRLFSDIVATYAEAGTNDPLASVLYSDYSTVVGFYLRRNDLNRSLGIETRYPMFDVDLMEFCARIPSRLKIHGWFDAKHIMKTAIEPWLPGDIVHRKDKLGHSIPMKNWLRDNDDVRSFVGDLLSAGRLQGRGLVDPAYVRRLWDEHERSRANHAHKLWSLALLELWLKRHFDGAEPGRGQP
jgi:asparagine synthase (glutamine-hydrolysing)